MTEEEAAREAVARLMERARKVLAAAQRDYQADDMESAMSRVYYACFHALSAVLVTRKLVFSRHAGVRAALHQLLVKTGRIDAALGRFYDEVFEARQEADYVMGASFDTETVAECIAGADQFIDVMQRIATDPF